MHPTGDEPRGAGGDPLLPDIDPDKDPNVIVPFPDPQPERPPARDPDHPERPDD